MEPFRCWKRDGGVLDASVELRLVLFLDSRASMMMRQRNDRWSGYLEGRVERKVRTPFITRLSREPSGSRTDRA